MAEITIKIVFRPKTYHDPRKFELQEAVSNILKSHAEYLTEHHGAAGVGKEGWVVYDKYEAVLTWRAIRKDAIQEEPIIPESWKTNRKGENK